MVRSNIISINKSDQTAQRRIGLPPRRPDPRAWIALIGIKSIIKSNRTADPVLYYRLFCLLFFGSLAEQLLQGFGPRLHYLDIYLADIRRDIPSVDALPLLFPFSNGMLASSSGEEDLPSLGARQVCAHGKSLAIAAPGNLYRVAGHAQDISFNLVADMFSQKLACSWILKLYLIGFSALGI